MAQRVRVLAAVPEDVSSTYRTHAIEREDLLLQIVFWLPHMHLGGHTQTYLLMRVNTCKVKFNGTTIKSTSLIEIRQR